MAFGRALAVQHCKNQLKRTSSRRDGDFDPASAHQAQPGQTQCVQFAMPFRTHDSHFLRDGGMMWPVYVEVFTRVSRPRRPGLSGQLSFAQRRFCHRVFRGPFDAPRARQRIYVLLCISVVLSRRSRLVALPAREQTQCCGRCFAGHWRQSRAGRRGLDRFLYRNVSDGFDICEPGGLCAV